MGAGRELRTAWEREDITLTIKNVNAMNFSTTNRTHLAILPLALWALIVGAPALALADDQLEEAQEAAFRKAVEVVAPSVVRI